MSEEKKVVNTQYIITRKVVSIEYHKVDANSKAEALRIVEEDGSDDYESYYSHQHKPKFDSFLRTYECPNKHNGWTSASLDVEIGSIQWHYNGMCVGGYPEGNYHVQGDEMCSVCKHAKQNGYRLLTQDELQYLSDTYELVIE